MRRVAVAALVGVAVIATPALAVYLDSATASAAFSTTQLAAPTGLTATAACAGTAASKVTLGWTATTTTFATGYDIYRAVGVGPSTFLASVSPRTTVAYVDTAVLLLTSYTYTVKARYASWSKASTTASATTPVVCL